MWNFCPSIGAAYLFIVLFGLTTVGHVVQAIMHRKLYCWVIAMSGTIQTITYIFRVLSILNPASYEEYAAWFVLILVAPLWTNAFVYMIMGRMVYGAAQAAGNNVSYSTEMTGLHIYMAGVGIQQFFVLVFVVYAISFHRKILRQHRPDGKKALLLLSVLYACLALITMRIVFRLSEYSQGLDSRLPLHEAYQYCLDSLPMLLALVMVNAVHPGRIMPGKDADIPNRKQRKKLNILNKPGILGDDAVCLEEC
ncbi:hypothetical protein N7454_008496 [Penicillium verhagenii]|nr:hypothetical protein N7454_008496 [Penicillium verhagenii]